MNLICLSQRTGRLMASDKENISPVADEKGHHQS